MVALRTAPVLREVHIRTRILTSLMRGETDSCREVEAEDEEIEVEVVGDGEVSLPIELLSKQRQTPWMTFQLYLQHPKPANPLRSYL